jgi:hypothetical protein
MGTQKAVTLVPELPAIDSLDLNSMEIYYDRVLDTLFIHLFERKRMAIVSFVDSHAALRIDPHTRELIGFQIEDFQEAAVIDNPDLISLAELAGIPDEELAEIRARIPTDVRKRRALRSLLADITLPIPVAAATSGGG